MWVCALIEQGKDRGGRIEIFFATKIDATDIHLKVNKTLCVCLLSLLHWTMRNKLGESDGKSLKTVEKGMYLSWGELRLGSALALQSLRQWVRWQPQCSPQPWHDGWPGHSARSKEISIAQMGKVLWDCFIAKEVTQGEKNDLSRWEIFLQRDFFCLTWALLPAFQSTAQRKAVPKALSLWGLHPKAPLCLAIYYNCLGDH